MLPSFAQLEPLAWVGIPTVLAGLGWQARRYHFPPELIAAAAVLALPVAGLWRPDLAAAAWAGSSWLGLLALLMVSTLVAIRIPARSKLHLVLLGLLAGGLPAAWLGARAGHTPRDAGRLALIGAGAGAVSPLGGPVQCLLGGLSLDWWWVCAPAGAAAIAVSWRGTVLGVEPSPPLPRLTRARLLLAVCLAGCALHIAGAPWGLAALSLSPPAELPAWLVVAAAWAAGGLIDPWLATDVLVRARDLGADGALLSGLTAGLSLPSAAILLIAWHQRGREAAWHAIPGLLLALGCGLLLS